MQTYRVRVTKDYLVFCSAHFIFFDDDKCERLHGHNYKVTAELEGPLDPDHLVFDFIVLKKLLREIVNELDHRMLVPMKSRQLRIEETEKEIRLSHREKQWIFPSGDCVRLPIENTTAELLARWIAERLREDIDRTAKRRFDGVIRMEVEESTGQSAVYELPART
jgi:6-pyruvoyltetrahydropterin/6-carboxytetrahydropterin synthase